ncbi:Cytosolic copper metallochaperone [Dipsacomyces acuminosporus]|nr:Cytosolic copper metallochaperone [Dipsacomyces acuminosporus]
MPNTYEFEVAMSCSGCSGAVERALKRVEGVESIDISLEAQKVKVTTDLPRELILETIKKTGKPVKE